MIDSIDVVVGHDDGVGHMMLIVFNSIASLFKILSTIQDTSVQ